MRPGSLFTKLAPAAPQGWMVSPSSSTRIAQLSWNSSFAFYKEPGGKDTSHKNGAWLMGSGYPRRRTPLEWAPFAQSLSSTSKARFSSEGSPGEWHHSSSRTSISTRQSRRLASQGSLVAWSMLKWSGIRWWLQSARRKNSTSYGLTWPMPMDLCPHNCIRFALKFFHIPEKVADILMQYFGNVFMCFTTTDYMTGWQALEVGIMMGCVVSPLLFVMCMELILRGTTDTASGEETRSGGVLPPSRAFMDDVTTLVQSKAGTQELLDRFHDLFTWARMKAKPKKSRSISLVRGTICDIHFSIGGNIIPAVREQPVKSLGRLYAFPLTDRHRGVEVEGTALEGLHAIEKSELPGKLKAWCFQHGLLPRLLWPLQIYEISLSRVETIQQHINKYLRKWLGVPPCFSTVGLYTATGMLQLPFSSITEEFKVGKARLHLMLWDSSDDVIRQVQPEVRTGTKWSAAKALQEAEASLQIKEVIGATQTGTAGLGSTPHRWFSRKDSRGRRDMVITELKMIEEEKRVATAAGQAKQCAWMNWEEAEARKLSWSSLMTMEPLALSFLLRSTCNLLPTPANHKQWGFTGDDTCAMCKRDPVACSFILWEFTSDVHMAP